MAFVKAPKTLDHVQWLISELKAREDSKLIHKKFLERWDKELDTTYSKFGKVELSKYAALPQEDKPSLLFMEMSSIHNLLKSSLNKNKRYLQAELTPKMMIARLKNAVNVYIGDLLDYAVPHVEYKQGELESIKTTDLSGKLKKDSIANATKRKNLVDRVNLTVSENEFGEGYDEFNPKESVNAIRAKYLEKNELEVYELNSEEEYIAEIYGRPW